MGYTLFALCYNDLSISYHVAGNLLDFVTLPEGKKINDLKTVLPHKKGDQTNLLRTPEYSWCLFSE
jgi:hypothetical protein